MITASRSEELAAVLARFEDQYEAQTERLARLMARRRTDRRSAVYNLAEIAACRKALADAARVLQRLADRDFGRCPVCAGEIPLDWILAEPARRHCPQCAEAVPA